MSMPDLQPVAAQLYELLEPLTGYEVQYDYALAKALQAWCLPYEEAFPLAQDPTIMVDIDRTPDKFVPWLGQFVGVLPRAGLTPEAARLRVRETDGWLRGTPGAIVGAAKQYLTGQKRVSLHERTTGAYRLSIITYEDETPDEAAVRSALEEQVPWGLKWTYDVMPGQTFRDLRDNYATFRTVRNTFPTFRDVRDNEAGV